MTNPIAKVLQSTMASSPTSSDLGLLFLRIASTSLLFWLHGWPKVANFQAEITRIEDPFGMGGLTTLTLAIFAQVFCSALILFGVATRLSTLPILFLLAVATWVVHPQWTHGEAQFSYLFMVAFATLLITGAGRFSFDASFSAALQDGFK